MNKKRMRFCDEWMIDFNQTKAAQRAGYSKRSAGNQGHRLMQNDEIQKELKSRLDVYAFEASEVLARLGQMGRGKVPTKIVKEGKHIKETFDAQGALEKLGKVHAMFVEKHITLFDDLEVIDDDE